MFQHPADLWVCFIGVQDLFRFLNKKVITVMAEAAFDGFYELISYQCVVMHPPPSQSTGRKLERSILEHESHSPSILSSSAQGCPD